MNYIITILLALTCALRATAQTNFQDLIENGLPTARVNWLPASSLSGNMETATNLIHYQVINIGADYTVTAAETNGMHTTNLIYVVNTMASNVTVTFPVSFINTFTVFNAGTNWTICAAANGNTFMTFPANGGLTYSTALNNKFVGKSQTFLMINQTNYIVASDFRPLPNIIFDVTNNIASVSGTNGTNGTNGLNGATGSQGIQGIQGLNGTNAATGLVTNQFTTNLALVISQFQPASANLTNIASLNGSGLTNLPFAFSFSSTNGYFAASASGVQMGATNWTFVITNILGLPVTLDVTMTNQLAATNSIWAFTDQRWTNNLFNWTNVFKLQAGAAISGSNYLITIATGVTNRTVATNGSASIWLSGFAVITNGAYSVVSNAAPVASFAITASITNFFTNNFGRDIIIGYTATTLTGIGLCGTNGGAGGSFQQWLQPLTGGTVPLRNGHTVSFTNGASGATATWTVFP